MEPVELLDDYSVAVNLKNAQRLLRVPFLDINDAGVPQSIVDANQLLLTSGVWGIGNLVYTPPETGTDHGRVWVREFKPFQVSTVDIDYYAECRSAFTLQEWIDLLISSMGFNPAVYNERQKRVLLARIVPIVEPRVNLVELAPKGTGKSFVYDNLSRYARVIAGGR